MTKVIVYHRGYGCQTGCCGHAVQINGDEDNEEFQFEHPYQRTDEEFVRWMVTETMGADHVADIDWENCIVISD